MSILGQFLFDFGNLSLIFEVVLVDFSYFSSTADRQFLAEFWSIYQMWVSLTRQEAGHPQACSALVESSEVSSILSIHEHTRSALKDVMHVLHILVDLQPPGQTTLRLLHVMPGELCLL